MNWRLGEIAAAEALVESALALAREAGNRSLQAVALNNLSTYVVDQGDFARAHRLLEEAIAINHELGNREWELINLDNVGEFFIEEGNLAEAQAPLARAVALGRELGGRLEAMALGSMARLAEQRGDHGQARTLSAEALAICRGLASPAEEEVERMPVLARLCVACDEPGSAAQYLAEALVISRKFGYRESVVRCLDVMVGLAIKVRAFEKAVVFRGACQRLREITGVLATPAEIEQSERYSAECLGALGDAAFAAAGSAGGSLSIESVISTGLEWLETIAQPRPAPGVAPVVKAVAALRGEDLSPSL
jgi:tetratricopeptide (TPR) repeat protein